MFGYAVDETPELMPAPIQYAHAILRRLAESGAQMIVADGMDKDIRRAEVIALPVVALMLFFVFGGAVAAFLPVLIGGLTVGGTLFEELGFYYVGPIDGHDLDQIAGIDVASHVVSRNLDQAEAGKAARDICFCAVHRDTPAQRRRAQGAVFHPFPSLHSAA